MPLPRLPAMTFLSWCLFAASAQAAATFSSPTPYLQASDNPVAIGAYAYSHLEDLEDNLVNTPGLTASGGGTASLSAFTDSVDADDGAIDNSGVNGHSWYSAGLPSITFSFSSSMLGSLPTVVGIAFTDIGGRSDGGLLGFDDALMEVFDGAGVSLGSLSFAFGDGSAFSATAEDRFVTASFAGGIGSLRVGFAHSVDWEVDHVFYAAAAVPESATAALLAAGAAALALALRLRRRTSPGAARR